MKALLLREIKSFFGSPIGYLVIAIFLLLNGLFLWVFEGDFNILNSGFADLTPFFTLSPWILIFLIPAVTMRSFSDEKKQGTIELLFTKPLSIWEIVGGKFFGGLILIFLSLLPTIVYVLVVYFLSIQGVAYDIFSFHGLMYIFTGLTSILTFFQAIWKLFIGKFKQGIGLLITALILFWILRYFFVAITIGTTGGHLDIGSTMGSYFGLLFLIAGYTAVGIFTSTLSDNQIVAFIIAVFVCFLFYFGFDGLASFAGGLGDFVKAFGMDYHYRSMSRGVLDTRDIIYFLSVTTLFLSLTVYKLKSMKA